jgi:hypothetical protein
VDMCKGKRKYDHEAPMTSSLSDCTWLENEWKFRLSTTWHPSLHFIFFLYLIHPSHIFLAIPLLSFSSFSFFQSLSFNLSYAYFFFTFLFFFLSFPYTYFSLYFSLSWHIYLSFQSSQLLSFLHKHNLNFKNKTMLETRRNFESRLCSRNMMYKRDIKVWVWNSAMYGTSDVKVTLPNAWRG